MRFCVGVATIVLKTIKASIVATRFYFVDTGERKTTKMILFLNSFFTFVLLAASTDILVIREKNYDTVVWDGDCHKIQANNYTFGGKKACICKKNLEANGLTSEIGGFFYQTGDHLPTCLYDFRETGKLMV